MQTGSGKGPYIPQNIATTQPVTPFDMYMLTTGHQWAHAPEAEKDRYYKQAALLDSALPVKREREAAVKPVAQTGDQHARKSIQNTAGASPQAPERKVKRGEWSAEHERKTDMWLTVCEASRVWPLQAEACCMASTQEKYIAWIHCHMAGVHCLGLMSSVCSLGAYS